MIFKLFHKTIWHIYINNLIKMRINDFASYGNNTRFSPHTSFFTYNTIKLGNNVFINSGAYFAGRISVGNDVLFGPNVIITSGHHDFNKVGRKIQEQGRPEKKEIIVLSDSWIGAGSIILQNSMINEGVIVGAGSIVTKEMPPYCVCLGNPCKPIKYRYSDTELKEHLKVMNKTDEEIELIISKRKAMFNEY